MKVKISYVVLIKIFKSKKRFKHAREHDPRFVIDIHVARAAERHTRYRWF